MIRRWWVSADVSERFLAIAVAFYALSNVCLWSAQIYTVARHHSACDHVSCTWGTTTTAGVAWKGSCVCRQPTANAGDRL